MVGSTEIRDYFGFLQRRVWNQLLRLIFPPHCLPWLGWLLVFLGWVAIYIALCISKYNSTFTPSQFLIIGTCLMCPCGTWQGEHCEAEPNSYGWRTRWEGGQPALVLAGQCRPWGSLRRRGLHLSVWPPHGQGPSSRCGSVLYMAVLKNKPVNKTPCD